MVVRSSIIEALQQARGRGAAYLIEHQRADGAVGEPERDGLGPYYKTIWALHAAGETAAANRLASWVANNVQTAEGDFAGPLRGTLQDSNYAYPNAWMICGAQKAERFDVAARGMRFLLTLQDPETGGFRMQLGKPDAIQDVLNASQSGNACLLTGYMPAADGVARFLRTVWEAQPRPDEELFFVYKPGQGLRTEFPAERQRLHSIRIDTRRQSYFNMGIAAAFLARYVQAGGDGANMQLAKDYLSLAFKVLDEMYETAQVGKVGWGSALVYAVTGDERYRALAERVGEAMVAQQTDTGGWDNTGGYVNDAIRIEVTAEFVMLVDEMIGGLASR